MELTITRVLAWRSRIAFSCLAIYTVSLALIGSMDIAIASVVWFVGSPIIFLGVDMMIYSRAKSHIEKFIAFDRSLNKEASCYLLEEIQELCRRHLFNSRHAMLLREQYNKAKAGIPYSKRTANLIRRMPQPNLKQLQKAV